MENSSVLDSSQVYSLADHQRFCWIVESCCFGNFWPPEILRVFLAAGALYRVISAFALARYSRFLKGLLLWLFKTGISLNQEWKDLSDTFTKG